MMGAPILPLPRCPSQPTGSQRKRGVRAPTPFARPSCSPPTTRAPPCRTCSTSSASTSIEATRSRWSPTAPPMTPPRSPGATRSASSSTPPTEAQGENVVIMDADATYPVPAIKEMVELLDDHDLVRGVRESEPESMPFVNRVGNWLFNKLLAISHGLEGTDHLSGLYAMRRSEAVRLGTEARGFDIETEIGIKAKARGLREAEIPISYLPRVGEKKLSPWKDGLRILGRVIVLLLIYNPTLTFIVPGLVLMAISVTGAVLLSNGPVHTSYLGLNIHSFIVAALGVLAAFQLVIFGVAAALYGVEAGKEPPRWLRWVISVRFRLSVGLVGLLLMLGSIAKLTQLTIQWAGNNVFTDTRALVLTTSFLVLGLQVISAVLFISIFSGRLSRIVEEDAAEKSGAG